MSTWTEKEIADALSSDGLASAERITGKSYKEDEETKMLGLMLHSKGVAARDLLMQQSGDTPFSCSMDEYCEIIKRIGFRCVLTIPFVGRYGDDETLQIWFCDRIGALLKFDSFQGNRNSGEIFYNWKPNDLNGDWRRATSSGCMSVSGVWIGDHDCREALAFNLQRLESLGAFVTPWVKRPSSFWLTHYMDNKGIEDTRKRIELNNQISEERIQMLPADVLAAITPS